jgi:TrmH family RNA methyltransferase
VISIRKLKSLPRKTRLRKLVALLQAEERELRAGRKPHREYVACLCTVLAGDAGCGREIHEAAEECRRLCDSAASQGAAIRRQINRVRHALLRYLGAEPAEWDLLVPFSEELDAAARTILPIQLYLEEIRSPFNVGAIFRSSEAFGVGSLLLSPHTASPLHPRAVRSARGVIGIMPWRFVGLEEIGEQEGIFALELGGTPLEEFCFPERGIMLVGSEELGLSPRSLALAASKAGRVSIPMSGAKRSLNVAVAVGIVLQAWHARLTLRRSEPSAKEGTKRTSAPRTARDEPLVP